MKTENKMKRVYTGLMAAMMISAATLTFSACSSEAEEMLLPEVPEQTEQPAANHTYTLSVNASKGEDGTRALSLSNDGNDIKATWAVGDVVTVYKGDVKIGELTAQNGGANTTLTGEMTTAPEQNDELTLKYLSPDYNSQKGTLESIAEKCDYAVATVMVNSVTEEGAISTTDAAFVNQQAIVKFTLKDKNGTEINPSSFSVKYGDASIEIKDIPQSTYTTNGAGVLYVAIPGGESKDVVLKANVESTVYTFMRHSVAFTNANYYPINVTMKWDELENPLTFEAKEAGATVVCTIGNKVVNSGQMNYIEYKIEGATQWEHINITGSDQITFSVTLDNIGDKVMFRGYNTSLGTGTDDYTSTNFSGSEGSQFYVYGNVMSLLYPTDLANNNSFPENSSCTFACLFDGNTTIYNHPYKPLILPATTLKNKCYAYMFRGCKKLTTAPDLLATEAANGCYYSMFYNCSNLNSVRCYLNPNEDNTKSWLYKVASSGTFYKKNEKEWPLGPSGKPNGWNVVDE